MIRFFILLAVLFAAAVGFTWLKGTPGEVTLTIRDTAYAVDLTTAAVALFSVVLFGMAVVWLVRTLLSAPWRMARGLRHRNQELGRTALSNGLMAIAAGDVRGAERATQEARRRLPDQPLTKLLRAQAAQLKGDRTAARQIFQEMTDAPATRIAGLRGLYIEAEREGELVAAHQIAERARVEAPSAPWAARALLRHQTAAADWDGALATLSGSTDGRIIDKRTARRQRAVILTAKALAKEDGEPDVARQAALEAHDLAHDLVPAAVVAGRLLTRQGDVRRASRVLEAAWKAGPHPEVADAYLHARSGDSAGDRLKRAETLARLRPHADEGKHAVARAAIDARAFQRARDMLTPLVTTRPTQKALMLMAELEEAETGDRGRARGWQARAVYAPRDPAWTADGIVLEEWAPVSPTTGALDAVEWKVPVAELEGPKLEIDAAELTAPRTEPEEAPKAVIEQQKDSAENASAPLADEPEAGEPEAAPTPQEAEPPKEAAGRPKPDAPADKAGAVLAASAATTAATGASAGPSSSADATQLAAEAVGPESSRAPSDTASETERRVVSQPDAPAPDGPVAVEAEEDGKDGGPMVPPLPDDPGVSSDDEETAPQALPSFLSRTGGPARRHA